jgi:hypothetical protein
VAAAASVGAAVQAARERLGEFVAALGALRTLNDESVHFSNATLGASMANNPVLAAQHSGGLPRMAHVPVVRTTLALL